MKIVSLFIISFFFAFSNAYADKSTDSKANAPKIPEGANTVVIALSENPDVVFKKFKKRAVAQDYYLTHVDDGARVFLTNFYDLSKKTSIQIKTYVKAVKSGGANVVINAKFLKLKKLKRYPNYRPMKLRYKKDGNYGKEAWKAFHLYAVGNQEWKHQFIRHEI